MLEHLNNAMYLFIAGVFVLASLVVYGIYLRSKYTYVTIFGYRRYSDPHNVTKFPKPLQVKWLKDNPPKTIDILLDSATREWSATGSSAEIFFLVGFQALVIPYHDAKKGTKYNLGLTNNASVFGLEYEIE